VRFVLLDVPMSSKRTSQSSLGAFAPPVMSSVERHPHPSLYGFAETIDVAARVFGIALAMRRWTSSRDAAQSAFGQFEPFEGYAKDSVKQSLAGRDEAFLESVVSL